MLSGQNSINRITEDSKVNICPEALFRLDKLFGSAKSYTFEKVKVKLSDVAIEWSDQFGMGKCTANIENVERI